MSRSVPEWIGKTDDTKPPPRVCLRVFEKNKGVCQCGCGIKINGKPWDTDHTVALINGGENRESNLRTLLRSHHKIKTAADVAEKARVTRKRMASIGLKVRRGPPMPGSRNSPFKRKMNGTVERR